MRWGVVGTGTVTTSTVGFPEEGLDAGGGVFHASKKGKGIPSRGVSIRNGALKRNRCSGNDP